MTETYLDGANKGNIECPTNAPVDFVDPFGLDTLRARVIALAAQGDFVQAIGLAESGLLTGIAAKYQTIVSSIQSLITRYPAYSRKCVQLANNIYKTLKSADIKPQILQLKGTTEYLIDGAGKVFSEIGKHYIVKVGNRVFDAFTGADGMVYSEYLAMWEELDGV